MFILMKSGLGLYLGHLESGTRSLGQIIEKHCVDNRGHSFHLILMSQVSDSGPSWPSCFIIYVYFLYCSMYIFVTMHMIGFE